MLRRALSSLLCALLLVGSGPLAAEADTVTLVGAGDIASCVSTADSATADLVDGIAGTVFTAGDNAYSDGTATDFAQCYDPTWGRFRNRTQPSPGNHDYRTAGAAGYFGYFGAAAGPAGLGYYAYDLGDWRVYSLNSEVLGSTQLDWLKADLAANPRACSLAYWHRPLFSSGQHGNDSTVKPFWDALYAAGADLIINGHDHDYERFAPQNPSGQADTQFGIRELVVGTGGAESRAFATIRANSEARASAVFGAVVLTLSDTGYSGAFRVTDGSVDDTFSGSCHGAPQVTPPPPPGGFTLTASAVGGQVNLSWTAVTGATKYRVQRALATGSFTVLSRQTGTTYTDSTVSAGTTYRYRIVAVVKPKTVKSNVATVTP
ncbi:MAG TPA: metallophosphoesterase [Candidatus Limnocylindria bacterium]